MNMDERHLSKLDIKYIASELGRNPSEIEINFIELILQNELKNREYLRILKRLDDGAKREVNNKIKLDDKRNLFVNSGIKIIDQNNKALFDRDETVYINNINKLDTVLNDIVINSLNIQNVEKLFKKEVNLRRNKNIFGCRYFKTEDSDIRFATSIGVEGIGENNVISKLENSTLFKINFGKRSVQKNINQFIKLLDEISNEDWFILAKSINWRGLGVALVDFIKENSHGITITKNITAETLNTYFIDDKSLSMLTAIQGVSLPKLKALCKKYELNVDEIGILTHDKVIHINNKDETIVNLPILVFDLQYNVNTKHFIQPEIDIKSSKSVSKEFTKTSFTNQLLKLLANIYTEDVSWNNSARKNTLSSNYSSYGLFSTDDLIDNQIVLTQADKNQLIDISPRLSGRISVASAVRRLTCAGAKPKAVIIQNIFPMMNKKSLWKASELLQGQEEAIRELDIEIGNRSIDTFEDYWHQNISAIGIHQQNSVKMDISFKNDGDFISLLGSHRGELTGSAYEQYITNEKSEVLPTVDLQMEKRLQDVVQQGINTNLIKSTVNVSAGGISIAIAKSLVASKSGLGVRIHLSRKLKEEELLFGETQGLVIVSLSEVDIMEFERICMTVGLPSTTIGRVTDNDLFTFNEAIKIKVDKLRKVIE